MFTRQENQKRLERYKIEDWSAQCKFAARSLPRKLKKIALDLLPGWRYGYNKEIQKANQKYGKALEALSDLNSTDRQRIFAVFFPKINNFLERAWQLHNRLPYQIGYWRKPFRVPDPSNLVAHARHNWFNMILTQLRGYDPDIAWLAGWAPFLGYYSNAVGLIFAAAIDHWDDAGREVYTILVDSANGEHEIGTMGHHVVTALLVAERPEGWDFIESLLLAAQRQEGLRQVILEAVDFAHPQAFRRMLNLILEQDLIRFTSVVRAVDVWFGFQWDTVDQKIVRKTISDTLQLLEDPQRQEISLQASDPQEVYLALWARAFENARDAVDPAAALLTSTDIEMRFVATHFLGLLDIPEARDPLFAMLDDEEIQVTVTALQGLFRNAYDSETYQHTNLFEHLERLLPQLPPKMHRTALVWPWMQTTLERKFVVSLMMSVLGRRSPQRMMPYLDYLEPDHRTQLVHKLIESPTPQAREIFLDFAGDRSRYVREAALQALQKQTQKSPLSVDELEHLEHLLLRKPADLRRGILELLLTQRDRGILESARRLLASRKENQRLGGLDLLNQMIEGDRSAADAKKMAKDWLREGKQLTTAENVLLQKINPDSSKDKTQEAGLGLYDPSRLTPSPKLHRQKHLLHGSRSKSLIQDRHLKLITALDEWVHQNRDEVIQISGYQGVREELLGNLQYGFTNPDPSIPLEGDIIRLPLRKPLQDWWETTGRTLAEPEGLGLICARIALSHGGSWSHWFDSPEPKVIRKLKKELYGDIEPLSIQYPHLIGDFLKWLLRLYPSPAAPAFILDACEHSFATAPDKIWQQIEKQDNDNPYHFFISRSYESIFSGWLLFATTHKAYNAHLWGDEDLIRLFRLQRWWEANAPALMRDASDLAVVLDAYLAGGATDADILHTLIQDDSHGQGYSYGYGYSSGILGTISGHQPSQLEKQYPILNQFIPVVRQRVVEIELKRGDLPTPTSHLARSLRYTGGVDVLLEILKSLGKANFICGYNSDPKSKSAVLSKLTLGTLPSKDDTPALFAQGVADAEIPPERLVELAIFAPQWTEYIEETLGWPGLKAGVFWLQAHTKGIGWKVDYHVQQNWAAEISEYTALSAQDLMAGAVDVAWFKRAYEKLGPEHWESLYQAAKYTAGGNGHTRAKLFSDALLGRLDPEALINRIQNKRHQDSVRALGLLPLPNTVDLKDALLKRYQILQEFLRTSRKFGAQRRKSEQLAVRIGIDNLARTAGYQDPHRLEWAMEAEETAALSEGPITVQAEDITLTLAVSSWGEAELSVSKKNRMLKNIPQRVKKDPQVIELMDLRKKVKQQGSRLRQSLENAMVRGDAFAGEDLQALLPHPVLGSMLSQLVFIGDLSLGFPVKSGQALAGYDGVQIPITRSDSFRIAHPYDLYQSGEWHHWQRICFQDGRVQPFKQIFRELYLLTDAEKRSSQYSQRYAGQQVNPKQAVALLGSRLWVSNYNDGDIKRTFHQEGVTAHLELLNTALTPGEVDGATLEGVVFSRSGHMKRMDLDDVPPRLFSEVMRDLDLVVSVAHRGGVDPEASHSTIEMRSALLHETLTLLNLGNVELKDSWALVDGMQGRYTVHLGSGVVHIQPGGTLCIIPIHSQHRGRIFLPFADNDPKTAEVISKVLTLAKDDEIKDPTILEQILHFRG